MRLKDPYYLLLLLFWIPLIWTYLHRERSRRSAIRFSDLSVFTKIPPTLLQRMRHIAFVLRLAGLGFLIVALARPQFGRSGSEISAEGIDIMMVLDISQSMQALDFKPDNRLAVAKQTIQEFVGKRSSDRVGLVVFAARAFTKCPLTLDHNVLATLISEVTFTDFSFQTAIGTAIATAANRLAESPAKSKIIILCTDGANNAGEIPPATAAEAAGQLGIKIYTIGIGREGRVPMPVQMRNPFTGEVVTQIRQVESDLDEAALKEIAEATGGSYFRAESPEKLKSIYEQIDTMEKTVITTKVYSSFDERFYPWLWAGFVLLLAAYLLLQTRLRRIP